MELGGDGVVVGHLPGIMIGAADVAGFAGFDEVVEGHDGFIDGGIGVGVMQLEEIDAVGLQAAEAAVEGVEDVDAGIAAEFVAVAVAFVDFGAEEDGVAFAVGFEDVSQEYFAIAVGVGGVDEVDAVVEGFVGDPLAHGLVDFFAEGHGAQGKAGGGHAGIAEASVLHGRHCKGGCASAKLWRGDKLIPKCERFRDLRGDSGYV